MATITFPILDNLTGPMLLDLMARYAKMVKKADPASNKLGWHQNETAISLGFKNWSMLHKHLSAVQWTYMDQVLDNALTKPALGAFIKKFAVKTIDEDEGRETMRDWVRERYTPLIDFALYDSESPNGFAWPDVDLGEVLRDNFSGEYPDDLIASVAYDLEANQGPWGEEDNDGPDDDDAPSMAA